MTIAEATARVKTYVESTGSNLAVAEVERISNQISNKEMCLHCGKYIENDWKVCPYYGAKIDGCCLE